MQFKHQKFQADAAKAVCDVFAGQPYLTPSYRIDQGYQGKEDDGRTYAQTTLSDERDFTGWSNQPLVRELNDSVVLEHLNKIQRANQIEPSPKLEGHYNLTIEMETGVGKTYTYIKTMYELNKRYGWSKYIVVVPSIAIREGVCKSFEITQEHFAEEYYDDRKNSALQVAAEVADCAADVLAIVDSIYDSRAMQPENARSNNVELQIDPDKLAMPEFKALWKKINAKSVYVVDFDTGELVRKAIDALDRHLRVSKIYFKVETGRLDTIKSKDALLSGAAFVREESDTYDAKTKIAANRGVKYDLVGKLVEETGLTRKAVVAILTGIQKPVFDQFKDNPEEFILKAAALINDEKATAIIQHITYNVLDERYGTNVFTDPTLKGRLGANAMKAQKHLYDHILYDSDNEQKFAAVLDADKDVAVYVKLPGGFYISTPVGRYNPDWAIAFYEGTVKHIYFVAETKGTLDSLQLNHITPVEQAKIDCARAHFKAISDGSVVYDVVDSYQTLLERVMK